MLRFFRGKCIKTWMFFLKNDSKYWLCINTQRSRKEISKCAAVSQSTVRRLIKKFQIEKYLTPNRKGKCGRTKKTDAYFNGCSRTDAYSP